MVSSWYGPLLLAPFIGSFLGVLIRRLPLGHPVGFARSACEHCHERLTARELVPVLSYLAQGGRCVTCGAPIASAHLAVELAAVAVAGSAVLVCSDTLQLWLGCGLGWSLLALAWIDMEHMLLPDVLTLPLVLAGLAAGWLQDLGLPLDRALAAGGAYLAFRTIEVAYRRLRGRDGLGQGDAKLAAAAGAWLGIASLSTVILAGALFTFALAILWRGRYALRRTTAVPFGPGLCLATWAVWLLAA